MEKLRWRGGGGKEEDEEDEEEEKRTMEMLHAGERLDG